MEFELVMRESDMWEASMFVWIEELPRPSILLRLRVRSSAVVMT
jgi:hypothetical protein